MRSRKNKVDPVKDFKRTLRANHETNILAVGQPADRCGHGLQRRASIA
jgi:hypothetical protein